MPNFDPTTGITPTVLVRGGTGPVSEQSTSAKRRGVKLAARRGYDRLMHDGSVVDAVQEAVNSMELSAEFNAGYGSVLNWQDKCELSAVIMDGSNLHVGGVLSINNIFYPISLARKILDTFHTTHAILAGDGAMKFAKKNNIEILEEGTLVTPKSVNMLKEYRDYMDIAPNSLIPSLYADIINEPVLTKEQKQYFSPGSVAAVAIDCYGGVAAATSTGGSTGQMSGRIDSSTILGGGIYADNACGAVAACGQAENVMRFSVASRILGLIQHQGMTAQKATEQIINEMAYKFDEAADVICLDANGGIGVYFTAPGMCWAYKRGDEICSGVTRGEKVVEVVKRK